MKTRRTLQILKKTQKGLFRNSGFFVKSIINKNFHNSRNSKDIDMKLGPSNKLDKRNTATSKHCVDQLCHHCHIANLWLIWSNPEPGLQPHGLQLLHFH